jgi:TonB family protein
MFTSLHPDRSSSAIRRHRAVGLSVIAHLAVLAAIVFHNSAAIDLTGESLAYGNGAHTYHLIYSPAPGVTSPDAAKLIFPRIPRTPSKTRQQPQQKTVAPEPEPTQVTADASDHNAKAGSPLGTLIDGPITGHEVHVAYPVVYPDPPVERAELPRDLTGDVVIEVTIDSQGNVVETKIVQAIGHGIDEKIEATLRRWHYQPATLDGTPVASRHDVHFHFPS